MLNRHVTQHFHTEWMWNQAKRFEIGRLVQFLEDVLIRSSGVGACVYPDNETCLSQEVVTRLQKPVRQQRITEVTN
ncbi:hypothetical protein SCH4B_0233 [Ruegeria sp. TrichCH4B]|nr:hypothetical protein SCH4B_0233 [Ruegeria sp. TrichCH4B]